MAELTAVARCMLAIALAALLCGSVQAKTIFKCRASGGVTSYQDEPCPGRQIGIIRTSEPSAPKKAAPATGQANPVAAANTAPPPRTPRPSFQCTRPDGSRYYTADARPRRMLIDRLKGSSGVALPGAPGAPPGKIWAEDVCEPATRTQTCEYYKTEIAKVLEQAARSSGTEQRQLTREHKRLTAIHNHRCLR